MKIINKPIGEVVPYAKNHMIHSENQIKRIADSIKEFGFKNPVIIDSENVIIAGHGRVLAAEILGLQKIPCIIADDLTETQVKAYRIADNKLASLAEWDEAILAIELEELQDFDFDLDPIGFEDKEIQELIKQFSDNPDTESDDEVKDDVEPITKLGDLWELGKHRVLCGDSTDKETVSKLMDGQKADMVFTDPPYGVDYKGIKNDSRDGLANLLNSVFSNYFNFSKRGASIYCFHSDRNADIFHVEFRKYFHFSSMIIWNKNSLTMSQTDYQSKHEPCMYGWMEGGTHLWYSDRKQTSVWDINKESVEGHTTPKPVKIIENAINNSSKSGDIISDYFGGSGTTLIGAEKTGRISYIMELDEHYCDVIVNRYKEWCEKNDHKVSIKLNGKEYNGR